ncbi:MAG TPA: hypothetical protein VLV87_09005 [Gammaproteobacteria bacterium]|nr:hypothetical protein [Gammaproteobacteria bacterium]
MAIRYFVAGVGLMCCSAAFAAPQQSPEPGTAKAPPAAAKPCPQRGSMRGQGPVEQGMPCPGMQGDMMGPHAGPGPGMRQRAPAAGSAQRVYGWQLMTPEERAAYQAKMRAAKTAKERAAIRAQHHKEMQERAKQQGVTLPEPPGG